ncbi:MAG: carboxylating nicotinate-nucleotide diphosphorylase [Wenzhouxiangella sp.]
MAADLDQDIERIIATGLAEDIGSGDATTLAIVDAAQRARGCWTARQAGVICGLDVARRVFARIDPALIWNCSLNDGQTVTAGQCLVEFSGQARALLSGERLALNLVQRMSGIATATAAMVQALAGTSTRLLDTRKTAPGLRLLDKLAVVAGGGVNHRFGLFDMIMIKDNHIVAAGGIAAAVAKVRAAQPKMFVVVEASSLDEVSQALESGADRILLDNMDVDTLRAAVKLISGRAETEASGNVRLDTLAAVAATGVDYVSVGALTHSVQAFDISQSLHLPA